MQKLNSRFMSDLHLCQETPVLLTRTEVRRFLRINEATIDCWLRDHKLEQLPRLEHADDEVMIALRDEGLRQRFKRSIEGKSDVDLAIETLPAMARFQLLKMMMRPSRRKPGVGIRRGGTMRPLRIGRRRRSIRRSRRATPKLVRWESSRVSSRRAPTRTGQVSKGRRLGRARHGQFRSRIKGRSSKRRVEISSELTEQTVDMLFPPTQAKRQRRKPTVEPCEDLSALQAIAEASDTAEVAESLWGDDLLSLVQDVAESVAEEVEEQLETLEEEELLSPGEDEVWLALDGVEDQDLLAGTEEVLFSKDGGDLALTDPDVIEVELCENQDGELVGLVVEEEVAEPTEDVPLEPDLELATETAEVESELAKSPEEEAVEHSDDGFLELDLGAEDWMPGEEMFEALSHSPVFAGEEPGAEESSAEEVAAEFEQAVADTPSPTELEIDELFTPLDAAKLEEQSEMSEFISEESAALYRIEEQLSFIEETTAQHREESFAELAEVRADIAATWSQEAVIIEAVGSIEGDIKVLKKEVKATRKSARSSLTVSRRTQTQLRRRLKKLGVVQVGGKSAVVLPVAAGVLITSWAMTIYLKTGDLRMALGGLVLVNVLACASLLHSKTGRFF